jgi:hypothetical protein
MRWRFTRLIRVDRYAYLPGTCGYQPGDFPSFAAYEAARALVLEELIDCERQHGEIPPA